MNTTERKPIGFGVNGMELLTTMGEGNPGAFTVLAMLLKESQDNFGLILDLDDMNIRGTQIWVAYKDHCCQDMARFNKLVGDRDKDMIDTVNRVGLKGNHPHKAVHDGGSYPGGRQMLK